MYQELESVKEKVYTRDLYNKDWFHNLK
jgi:hypothetical protein